MLDHFQIEDLLDYIGVDKVQDWKGDKIQFCCPIHGESNPSCGINADFVPEDRPNEHYQVFHCFSCGAKGTLPWFLFKSLPDEFHDVREAEKFIKDRYGVSFLHSSKSDSLALSRYEDLMSPTISKRFTLPKSELAPYKSGKETYKYFYDRGFDKSDVVEYMIGRDLASKTVTIPVFWEDGVLAGILGRYISKSRPKNQRFKIYNFPKGSLIYPLDKLKVIDNTIIGVESIFDAIMLRKWGYLNTVALMGDGMSKQQADQISSRCSKFIPLFDLDDGGKIACDIAKKRLGSRVMILEPTYVPPSGKDPMEWGELQTVKRIESASLISSEMPRL